MNFGKQSLSAAISRLANNLDKQSNLAPFFIVPFLSRALHISITTAYEIEIELGCDGDPYGKLMNYFSEGHGFKSQWKQVLFTVLNFNSKNVCCKVMMIGNHSMSSLS